MKQRSIDRFWSKVDKNGPNGCWEWTGGKTDGYGHYGSPGWHTHRLSWILINGNIPFGLMICHHCDNRCCCNPEHLYLGTDETNAQDMVMRGRCGNSRLTEDQVIKLRMEYQAGTTQRILAARYGISLLQVKNIIHGRAWKHLPLFPRR